MSKLFLGILESLGYFLVIGRLSFWWVLSNTTTKRVIRSFISFCSQFIGNGFVFWQFLGKTHIDSQTRIYVMSFLTGVVSLGTCCLMFLENIRQVILIWPSILQYNYWLTENCATNCFIIPDPLQKNPMKKNSKQTLGDQFLHLRTLWIS